MVYIPWAEKGICKYWMLQRCHSGKDCKWDHPVDRKALWDYYTEKQNEDEKRGIPQPVPPEPKRRERGRAEGRRSSPRSTSRSMSVDGEKSDNGRRYQSRHRGTSRSRSASPPSRQPNKRSSYDGSQRSYQPKSRDISFARRENPENYREGPYGPDRAPPPPDHPPPGDRACGFVIDTKGFDEGELARHYSPRPHAVSRTAGRAETRRVEWQDRDVEMGDNSGEEMYSPSVPTRAAVTVWKRGDMMKEASVAPEVDSRRIGDYIDQLKGRKAAQKQAMNAGNGQESNGRGRWTFEWTAADQYTKSWDSRNLTTQDSSTPEVTFSPFSPLPQPTILPPPPIHKMGATKRLSNGESKHVGPHPSTIRVSAPYMSQAAISKKLQQATSQSQLDIQERSIAEAREDSIRLQGVTWIDTVRRALQLPIRTYTTACVYYHKFRLAHAGTLNGMEYGNAWADACAASLLVSCKVEDTLKKSKDILAAAYNLKTTTHDQVSADDSIFEAPSKGVIGLERLVLEAGGFDFRSRYPHQLLVKIAKGMPEGVDDEREKVVKLAWTVCTDLYRTFGPLKQTTAAMALASLELAAHLVAASTDNNVSAIRDALQSLDLKTWSVTRHEIMETLLDLLDLYTQHTAHTILGTQYSLDDFLRIRLALNKECNEFNIPRYTAPPPRPHVPNDGTLHVSNGHPTPVSPMEPGPQPQTQTQTSNGNQAQAEGSGTVRFMLNPQRAADEKAEVQKYFVEEWEEYEEEVEVPQPATGPPSRDLGDRPRNSPLGRGERGNREGGSRGRDEHFRANHGDREADRERARLRDDRRYHDRRFDERDRRMHDRRDRRFDDRRYGEDRRRGR